mgnify:CR=1 FL=1
MTVYGSRVTNNRSKPGGDLGTKQYFYTTNKKTGEITVTRIEKSDIAASDVAVGTIPKGGKFTPSTDANATEKTYYNNNVGKVRASALQTARKEWDGKTQPPPNTLIYGADSLNKAYDPAGAVTGIESLKETNVSPKNTKTKSTKPRDDFKQDGSLVYPVALRQSSQDFLKIDMLEYAPKTRSTGDNIGGWSERNPNRKSIGTVVLPIPGGIQSSDTVGWGADKMDPAATAMANIALTTINKGVGAGFDQFANTAQAAVGNKDTRKALSNAIAGAASGTGSQLLSRTEGAIVNPNMELLFKDPGMRQFSFSYKLAPRSAAEAKTVISIIRFFKQGMAVKKGSGNLFLKAPNTFRLSYKHKGQDHKFLNKFKECAMNSFTANYTPEGNYATFDDGVMTSYDITLAFSELEPIFNNDYGDNFDEIGF